MSHLRLIIVAGCATEFNHGAQSGLNGGNLGKPFRSSTH